MSEAADTPTPEPRIVRFPSGDVECVGTLWLPTDAAPSATPIVVLGHGLGATRDMGLTAYAERFVAAGFAALTFDYRTFGDSEGMPRQILSVPKQLEDWCAAIEYAAALPEVDPIRVAIWGSSFGGGHVLELAATGAPVAAVIAQCPFTDGLASSTTLGIASTLKVGALAARDLAAAAVGRPPVLVDTAGAPGSAALMTAPDAKPGYDALIALSKHEHPGVAARIGLNIGRYRPGTHLRKITAPTLMQVCEPDTVAPHKATLRHVQRAGNPAIDCRTYPYGHFDVYLGAPFEAVIADQIAFLTKVL